jgi:hypothetical protein
MVGRGTDGHATERRLGGGFKNGRGIFVPPGRHDRGVYPKGTVMMFWAPIALIFVALCVAGWRYDRKHKVGIIGRPGASVDARGNDLLRHDQAGGADELGI